MGGAVVMRRFWRAVAKFACARAGLVAVEPARRSNIWTASPATTTVTGATVTWTANSSWQT